jgi:hypothetical protein
MSRCEGGVMSPPRRFQNGGTTSEIPTPSQWWGETSGRALAGTIQMNSGWNAPRSVLERSRILGYFSTWCRAQAITNLASVTRTGFNMSSPTRAVLSLSA